MIDLDQELRPSDLRPALQRMWELSGRKIRRIEAGRGERDGSAVFTRAGRYTAQGWTEWTEGFEYGSSILQFDAGGDEEFLEIGRRATLERMAAHVTHFGVHDHGFNNVSTYGNLWRLMNEGRLEESSWERAFYELALKCSGAVQAHRWTELGDGAGFIHSFNGPHSLFADTIRSLRSLAVAHQLGHDLQGERDRRVSLLERLVTHARATAKYSVYYGDGRDVYDVRGRVAHESVFDVVDGSYRCPNSQQGYSGFTTWTRGLAWVVLGFPEQLEFLATRPDEELAPFGGRAEVEAAFLDAARASADFYLEHTPRCGVPYWDTGAPGLAALGDWRDRPADPDNEHEPVDSSAAAIAAQGLLRLGAVLRSRGEDGARYTQAGLCVARTLLAEPYLSVEDAHEGLLLHAVYHRPNGWDSGGEDGAVPRGESCMWGDYHLRELALYVQRLADGGPPLQFFRSEDPGP